MNFKKLQKKMYTADNYRRQLEGKSLLIIIVLRSGKAIILRNVVKKRKNRFATLILDYGCPQ